MTGVALVSPRGATAADQQVTKGPSLDRGGGGGAEEVEEEEEQEHSGKQNKWFHTHARTRLIYPGACFERR